MYGFHYLIFVSVQLWNFFKGEWVEIDQFFATYPKEICILWRHNEYGADKNLA